MAQLGSNVVLLGNTHPMEGRRNEEGDVEQASIKRRLGITARDKEGPDGTITTFHLVPSDPLMEQFATVVRAYAEYHSQDPPEWVECENKLLEQSIAQHFTKDGHECVQGRPKGWRAYGEEVAS